MAYIGLITLLLLPLIGLSAIEAGALGRTSIGSVPLTPCASYVLAGLCMMRSWKRARDPDDRAGDATAPQFIRVGRATLAINVACVGLAFTAFGGFQILSGDLTKGFLRASLGSSSFAQSIMLKVPAPSLLARASLAYGATFARSRAPARATLLLGLNYVAGRPTGFAGAN